MTDSQNVCSDPGYLNSVSIRKRFQLLNVPPTRYNNLVNSPYDISNSLQQTFTQSQLDMRRKVEILKYSSNKTNTKTNNLTKREKWAQLVIGSSQKRNLSYSFIQENLIPGTTNYINTCPSGTILYTPTTASGIPGKIMNLYEDPTVPLYMYVTKTETYGLINQEADTREFLYDKELLNIYLDTSNNYGTITSIYIKNILTPTYTFNIEFPFSIFISGTVKPGTFNTSTSFKESIIIYYVSKPIESYIYFGSSKTVTTFSETIPQKKSVTFDISMNLSTGQTFYGNQYFGQYSMTNILLNTQPTFLYDLCSNRIDSTGTDLINIDTPVNSSLYTNFENIKYGVCLNVAYNSINKYTNCSVQSPTSFPSPSTYKSLSLI